MHHLSATIHRYLLLVLVIPIGWSCQHPKPVTPRRNNKITSISFASGGCFGRCPEFAMKIDSDLRIAFYGERYSEKAGFYTAKVTSDFWDSLNEQFERIHFDRLDSAYDQSVDDLAVMVTVCYGKTTKRVFGQSHDLPDSVRKAFDWLMNSYKRAALKPAPDTAHFYDQLRYPIVQPPIVYLDAPKITRPGRQRKTMHFTSGFGNFTLVAPRNWKYVKAEGVGSFDGRIAIGGRDTLDFALGFWATHLAKGQLQCVWNDELYVPAMVYPHKIDGYCIAYTEVPRDTVVSVARVYIDSIYSIGLMVVKFDFYGSNLSKAHEALFYQAARTIKFGERIHAQLTPDFKSPDN
jgi:Domain of unknown function (DUF6438)